MAGDVLKFLTYVQGVCASAGVRLRLESKKRNKSGDLGFFNEDTRVLYVAVANDNWPMILAHELGHLQQFVAGHPLWKEAATHHFEEWLAGKKRIPGPKLLSLTRAIQRLELDAERRALVMARKWGLTEDRGGYAQRANFYILCHEVARITGIWPTADKLPHYEALVASMPSHLVNRKLLGKLPPTMIQLCHDLRTAA
jgi:hypothetical protein